MVNFIVLWSILDSTCLSQRKDQWCSGLSLVPRKFRGVFIASNRGTLQKIFLLFDSNFSGSKNSKLCVEDHFYKVLALWNLVV